MFSLRHSLLPLGAALTLQACAVDASTDLKPSAEDLALDPADLGEGGADAVTEGYHVQGFLSVGGRDAIDINAEHRYVGFAPLVVEHGSVLTLDLRSQRGVSIPEASRDPILFVYEWRGVGRLSLLATNDDYEGSRDSHLELTIDGQKSLVVVASLYEQVSGTRGAFGALELTSQLTSPPPLFTLTCGGQARRECPTGKWCSYPEEACNMPEAVGTCADIPSTPVTCTTDYVPVCGCDGVTYGNACEARRAQTSVARRGECLSEPRTCGGLEGLDCGVGQWCKLAFASCGEDDQTGTCEIIPATPVNCPTDFEPVCGCDGTTYSNDCRADVAQVSVRASGECAP